jgi:hypothetical protein
MVVLKDSRDSRSAGLHVTPVLAVYLVHSGKVVHVRKENVHFDDLRDVRTGSFEDSCKILDTLVLERNVS